MRRLGVALLLAALATSTMGAGCDVDFLLRSLPELVRLGGAIVESVQLLRQLDSEAQRLYPRGVPQDYRAALQTCEATLSAVQRAQVEAGALDDPPLLAAIGAFRVAFVELRMAASRNGIITPAGTLAGVGSPGDSFGASAAGYRFPDPKLLEY